ncbi:MAG TPA: hypothetical protein VK870_02095 [Ignavibacteriaceae bacterium]|nr:hypothetical protein [Ignavibacteriaceae bacterium]
MKPYYFQNFFPLKPKATSTPGALRCAHRKYILEEKSFQNEEIVEKTKQ